MDGMQDFTLRTSGREIRDITAEVAPVVAAAGVRDGLCNVFVHHTSASLILCENADPSVRRDLERWLSRLVRDGDPLYTHTSEGMDDMPAHIRSVLTSSSISIPVRSGRLALGTWQGIYLWEHRSGSHRRQVSVTVIGSPAAVG